MMDLFSSFNPITNNHLSLNWLMIFLPSLFMMNSPWSLKSKSLTPTKMFMNIMNQFKSSMPKINTPNLIIVTMIMTLIMSYNILSLMPNLFSATSHIMINLSMALTLWLALMKKKTNNINKMLSTLTPSSTPSPLIPFMVLIELVSLMIQPITLSVRLTANITAGHIMMSLISQMYSITLLPTLLMNLMMLILELGVSIIQAYVFSMLIIMYNK